MARRPTICTYREVYEFDNNSLCDPAFFTHKILAEGDSWFTIGGHNLRNPWFSNILFTLRFPRDTLLLNLAYPGDTIKHISAMPRDYSFKFAIENQKNAPWNAIILSAGGNDLVDKAHTLILSEPERRNRTINTVSDYCNTNALKHFLKNIDSHFRRLANLRGNQNIPMIIHTYDYPTPNNAPAHFFGVARRGPWLYKVVNDAKIPKRDWIKLSDFLFDQLAKTVITLSRGQNRIPNFHVVDTRNRLVRARLGATGNSGDWLNEIHPNKNGYRKIAYLIERKLAQVAGFN